MLQLLDQCTLRRTIIKAYRDKKKKQNIEAENGTTKEWSREDDGKTTELRKEDGGKKPYGQGQGQGRLWLSVDLVKGNESEVNVSADLVAKRFYQRNAQHNNKIFNIHESFYNIIFHKYEGHI
ncbi:hypothetical protein Ahy_A09g043179 isoform D [Arachis hypogaea]|uniref:Uncharacterized protein n=1 Tax=Arachis hypogaea TaxID=3818 RepID=A0A445BHQ0_ARAHY|nr:hypothetical protein Ahy_A09g043179 isoform D [Arachis hypogaea]